MNSEITNIGPTNVKLTQNNTNFYVFKAFSLAFVSILSYFSMYLISALYSSRIAATQNITKFWFLASLYMTLLFLSNTHLMLIRSNNVDIHSSAHLFYKSSHYLKQTTQTKPNCNSSLTRLRWKVFSLERLWSLN